MCDTNPIGTDSASATEASAAPRSGAGPRTVALIGLAGVLVGAAATYFAHMGQIDESQRARAESVRLMERDSIRAAYLQLLPHFHEDEWFGSSSFSISLSAPGASREWRSFLLALNTLVSYASEDDSLEKAIVRYWVTIWAHADFQSRNPSTWQDWVDGSTRDIFERMQRRLPDFTDYVLEWRTEMMSSPGLQTLEAAQMLERLRDSTREARASLRAAVLRRIRCLSSQASY